MSQKIVLLSNNMGFRAGANLAFGSHFQRLGFSLNLFYVFGNFQSNSEIRTYFNFKNLGPDGLYPELVLSQGFVYGYGQKACCFNPFINSVSNQTGKISSFAYSYNAWFNTKKTRQQTGALCIEVNRFSFITENDILARGYYDRFRTAALLLQYQFADKWQVAVNCTMWTGEFAKSKQSVSPLFYNGCYRDTTDGLYTAKSHGLLSAQLKYNIGYSQIVQANLGIDAEQVRNEVQNRFIHDMRFVPKKWNTTKNCHIAMLDKNGSPFLYEAGQQIRKPRLYWNLFGNPNLFY